MQVELIETGSLVRSIEALLFVASEALSIKTLAKLTGTEEADVSVALQRIDADYTARGIAGVYRFASAPAARSAVEAYLMPPKTNLSPAALETLAIVAYLQPVTKGDIEGIRGVSADSVLSTLVDRRFLAEAGRKDVAGRPILYKTTPEFLEAFGLLSLEELPPIDIDAATPIELALPIQTQAVQRTAHANVFSDPASLPVTGAEADSTDAVRDGVRTSGGADEEAADVLAADERPASGADNESENVSAP
jgi:segregation and condensation protein B